MFFYSNRTIFFLLGPTCSGKTDLSLSLYYTYPFEIINFDSRLFYIDMNIGTSKPSNNVLSTINHNLVDIITPLMNYSVFNFCIDSFKLIMNCFKSGRIPLFVGGTMMYAWYFQKVFKYLKNYFKIYRDFLDFPYYLNLDFLDFSFVNIFLLPFDKDIFYSKIKKRVQTMFKDGFLDEVLFLRSLYGVTAESNSMKAVGYKEVFSYFNGNFSFLETIDNILFSTFDLAIGQVKWIKKFCNKSFYFDNNDRFILNKVSGIVGRYYR